MSYNQQFELRVLLKQFGDLLQSSIGFRFDLRLGGVEVDAIHGRVAGLGDVARKSRGIHGDEAALTCPGI
jgi:hypothetical protein